jgi:predicted aspartyl protease
VNAVKALCRFCFVLLVICLANPAWTINPPPADPIHSRSEVPFKLYAGYLIVVEGRIGDLDKLRFVLDTGVTHSVIDRKLASRVGTARRSRKILNFDKTVTAEWAEVPDLQFGPTRATHFSMMVSDLRYFQSFATRIDAVVGLDLLHLSSFSINYDARRISFGPVETLSGVPMNSDPVCLTVQLQAGDVLLRLIVDSGAPAVVLYEDRVLNRIPQIRIEGEAEGSSVGGYVHSKRAVLPRVRLGTVDLGGTVFLVKAPAGDALSRIDGYLGTAALKARRLNFNFESSTLAWKR